MAAKRIMRVCICICIMQQDASPLRDISHMRHAEKSNGQSLSFWQNTFHSPFFVSLLENILLKVCAGLRGDRRLLFKHRMMSKHFHSGGKNSCSFICRADSILTTFPFRNRHFSGPEWNLLPFDGAFLNRGLTNQSPVTVATHAWLMIYHMRYRTRLLPYLKVRKLRECKQVED